VDNSKQQQSNIGVTKRFIRFAYDSLARSIIAGIGSSKYRLKTAFYCALTFLSLYYTTLEFL
jgi:hypothetical protein